MTDPLAPFAELIAAAERGDLASRMAAQGLDRVVLGPASYTVNPDFTVRAESAQVRHVVGLHVIYDHPLWRGVVQARVATLQAIADALPDPVEELELVMG